MRFAHDLISAVRNGTCFPDVAAARIGSCDASADLLARPCDLASAIRCWGCAHPNAPAAWTMHLPERKRKRLLDALQCNASEISACIPWMPLDAVSEEGSDAIWGRVQKLALKSPHEAGRIVRSAPWKDLLDGVQTTIRQCADHCDTCAAIAVARGRRPVAPVTNRTADVVLAVIAPERWDALDSATRRQLQDALPPHLAYLAVRSPGLRPEILAHAGLNDDLIRTAQRYAHDDAEVRHAILPVALRTIPPDAAHALIAALPDMPIDAGAFFSIASKRGEPDIIAPAGAFAVTLRSGATGGNSIRNRWKAVQDALHGRTWNGVATIVPLLDDPARAALCPDLDALADSLAHPGRRAVMRWTPESIAALHPEAGAFALLMLEQWRVTRAVEQGESVQSAIAFGAHGDLFWNLVDAPANACLRAAMLPKPDDPKPAEALRALICDDPVIGRHPAHALQNRAWSDVSAALLDAPPLYMFAILTSLLDDDRETLLLHAETCALSLAADGCTDDLRAMWQRIANAAPLDALALAALAADDPAGRERGVVALAAPTHIARAILPLLRPDIRSVLRAHPALAAALADLSNESPLEHSLRTPL